MLEELPSWAREEQGSVLGRKGWGAHTPDPFHPGAGCLGTRRLMLGGLPRQLALQGHPPGGKPGLWAQVGSQRVLSKEMAELALAVIPSDEAMGKDGALSPARPWAGSSLREGVGEVGEVRVPCSFLAHSSSGEREGEPHMGCESGLNFNCPKGPEKLMGLGEGGREHTVTGRNKPCQWLYQQ